MKTAMEMLDRMEAFARKCSEKPAMTLFDSSVIVTEARAIVAELPPERDQDEMDLERLLRAWACIEYNEGLTPRRIDKGAFERTLAIYKQIQEGKRS